MNPCLQNSCSKELFGVIPGRLTSVLKKNSMLDVSLESMQSMRKFSEKLFFYNTRTDASECSESFFLEHQWTHLTWWIGNRRELSICCKLVLIPWLSTRKNINILPFFAIPLPMTMLVLRCRCQDFQMASIKTPSGCCFLIIELNENFLI